MNAEIAPIRQCGACSACCTVLGVPEIGKSTHEACGHLCEAGCAIYADRPGSCRTFRCEWLRGTLEADGSVDVDLRPDRCGVILEYRPDSPLGDVYQAWELEAGASARGWGRKLVDGFAERFLVVVSAGVPGGGEGLDGHRFVGPPHLVTQASDALWSRRA